MSTNTMYEMMRKSELMDDDGMDMEEADDCEQQSDAEKFKKQYKEFYTDIKISIKEDW